ncbi:MAG: FkbM family methyltransferase [Alkalispirochaeta sp.]
MKTKREIGGYRDIHHNMRFWMLTLTDTLVREAGIAGMADIGEAADSARWAGAGREPVVVYDIGANDGELTLPVAGGQLTAETDARPVQVVAFEPQPAVRARLMAHAAERGLSVALWGAADLTVVPLALGDRDDLIALTVFTDDTFSSVYARPADEMERYQLGVVETVRTRMRPLDDLVSGEIVPPPRLVKIDVEGAERAVLAGARETLSRYHPPVLVEFSCPNSANAGYDRREIVDALRSAGYDRVVGLFRNEDHALYTEDSFGDCRIWNVLAVNSSRSAAVTAVIDRYQSPWGGSP